jgi:hypothetical protein
MEEKIEKTMSSNENKETYEEDQVTHQESAQRIDEEVATGMDRLSITTSTMTIQDLKNLPQLWYKLHVLIYDLRNYDEVLASRERVEIVIDPCYVGSPYFTPSEASLVKSL